MNCPKGMCSGKSGEVQHFLLINAVIHNQQLRQIGLGQEGGNNNVQNQIEPVILTPESYENLATFLPSHCFSWLACCFAY